MEKITNAVLAERIRHYHEDMKENFNVCNTNIKDMKEKITLNTDFRKQAKTTIGLLTIIASTVGGFIFWVVDKIWL